MKNFHFKKPFFQIQPLSILFVVIAAFIVQACGGGSGGLSSKHAKIPADVNFVMSINFKSMSDKSKDFKELMNRDFLESMDMSPAEMMEMRETYEKIMNAGIDYKHKAYIFGKVSKDEKENYFAASFLLENPTKFEKALSESKEKPEIKKDGSLKYFAKDGGILGWDGVTAVFYGSDDKKQDESKLKEKLNKILKTSDAESLMSKNDEFRALDKGNQDFAVWVAIGEIMTTASDYAEMAKESPAIAEMFKVSKYSTYTVSFEKGEIVGEAVTHLDKNLSKKYEDLLKGGIHEKLMKAVPIQNPSAMIGMGIGMKALYNLLKDEKSLNDVEDAAKSLNLTTEELFDMLDGNVFVATKDLKYETLFNNPKPEFAFGLGINNQKTLDKILDEAKTLGVLEDKKDFMVTKGGGVEIYLIKKDKALFVTMTSAFKDDIVKNKGGLESKFTKMGADNCFLMYMDFQALFKQVPSEYDDYMKSFKDDVLPALESLYSVSTPVKNHKAEGKLIFKFTDKSKNALVIISEIMKKTAKASKKIS